MRLGGNELFASLLSREINCTTFERTRKTFFAVAEKKKFFSELILKEDVSRKKFVEHYFRSVSLPKYEFHGELIWKHWKSIKWIKFEKPLWKAVLQWFMKKRALLIFLSQIGVASIARTFKARLCDMTPFVLR